MREQRSYSNMFPLFTLGLFFAGFLATTLFLNGAFPLLKARAASADNVTGWAWSENIGWISLNNTDPGTNTEISYGVNINIDNTLAGWAWSENIGWVCFGQTCADEGYTPAPDSMPAWARVNPTSGEVFGWARILSIPDETGWISLRANTSADEQSVTYGVRICREENAPCAYTSPEGGIQTAQTGDFYYWAWSDAIGWIDFGPQVGGSHKGVKTTWIPTPPTPITITPQGGVFEPLCCNGGTQTGADCLASYDEATGAGDVYCDNIISRENADLQGTHLHTFTIEMKDLPVSQGTARCRVEMPGRCPDVLTPTEEDPNHIDPGPLCFPSFDSPCPGQCGNGMGTRTLSSPIAPNGTASLSYTVAREDVFPGTTEFAFWLLESCEYEDGGGTVTTLNIPKQPIFVHQNTWSVGAVSVEGQQQSGDQNRATLCYHHSAGEYFGNTVKCTDAGDFGFTGIQAMGHKVEVNCEDICTPNDPNDNLLDCGEEGWQRGTPCCTPQGWVDNNGNSEPDRNLYFANESEPYCEGIIYPRGKTFEPLKCDITADNSDLEPELCKGVILGICDIYADEADPSAFIDTNGGAGYCASEPFLNAPPAP